MKHRVAFLALALVATASRARAEEPSAAPLTLERAVQVALDSNETPRIAAARLEQARALRAEVDTLLYPRLSATGTYTRRAREVTRQLGDTSAVIQAQDAFGASATLQTTLFDASAIPLVRRARRNVEAVEHDAAELRRDLALDVASSFFAVLSAEQLRDAAARRREVASSAVEEARARLSAGLATSNELTRSQLELANAELARTRAANGVVAARLALGFLMGQDVEGPLSDPAAAQVAADREPKPLIDAALGAREDLKAQQQRVEAARLFAQEPWLRLFPSLALNGTYRATNETGFSGESTDWNVQLALTWVLYDGGLRYAQARGRSAALEEVRLGESALRRRIGLEIKSALADLDTAGAGLGQAEVRAQVAAQNAREVAERFAQGLASALERADAIVSQFEAEADLARQRLALRTSQLALLRALGRGPLESTR